jgi:hypothetical protein
MVVYCNEPWVIMWAKNKTFKNFSITLTNGTSKLPGIQTSNMQSGLMVILEIVENQGFKLATNS